MITVRKVFQPSWTVFDYNYLKNPKTEIFAQYFSMQCESWTISLPLKFLLFPNGDVVLRGVKTSESNFEKEQ